MKPTRFDRPRLHRQAGFSMVEMLVAIIVFSIGMIGVAIMQLKGMSYTKDAGSRSQATLLGRAMADRMRMTMQETLRAPVVGNVDPMEQVDYRLPGGSGASAACTANCTLQQAANNDLFWLTQQTTAKLPPPASGVRFSVARDAGTSQMHTVTLRWGEAGGDQQLAIQVYPL